MFNAQHHSRLLPEHAGRVRAAADPEHGRGVLVCTLRGGETLVPLPGATDCESEGSKNLAKQLAVLDLTK